jgi:hypothetical protein
VVRDTIPLEKAEACTEIAIVQLGVRDGVKDGQRLMQGLRSSYYLATTTNSQENPPGVDSPRYTGFYLPALKGINISQESWWELLSDLPGTQWPASWWLTSRSVFLVKTERTRGEELRGKLKIAASLEISGLGICRLNKRSKSGSTA